MRFLHPAGVGLPDTVATEGRTSQSAADMTAAFGVFSEAGLLDRLPPNHRWGLYVIAPLH